MYNFFKLQTELGKITEESYLDFQLSKNRITKEQHIEIVEILRNTKRAGKN